MPNNTSYNNKASSNIVYLYGGSTQHGGDPDDCDCCSFGVVPIRADLVYISDPQNFDVVFIQDGANGGMDVAIYMDGEWIVKSLKGAKGDKGKLKKKPMPDLEAITGSNVITGDLMYLNHTNIRSLEILGSNTITGNVTPFTK